MAIWKWSEFCRVGMKEKTSYRKWSLKKGRHTVAFIGVKCNSRTGSLL